MTPEQRAEKIVFAIFHEPKMYHPEYETLIAAEIRAAVEEATRKALRQKHDELLPLGLQDMMGFYKAEVANLERINQVKGKAEAFEEAAKMANDEYGCDALAEQIRAKAKELK